MVYYSYEDLSDCIRKNVWKVPADVDLIVGVPRSGMIPALMLAELLNKRCADIDAFIEGRLMSCGGRESLIRNTPFSASDGSAFAITKVLVIDDTVYAGTAMRRTKQRLAHLEKQYNIIYASVFAEGRNAKQMVDIYFQDIYRPGEKNWLYEWNILHHYHKKTESALWDIDGLLCKDPPDDSNQAAYENYLPNAIPMIIPTTKVGALVTYRIERYRDITQRWLEKQGVQYGQLIMFNAMTREERNKTQGPARYKAAIYAQAQWAKLFCESEARQAARIHQLTGKPVFCYENGQMYI